MSKNALYKIKKLLEELEERDEILEKQEDLLILENETNLKLENLLKLKKNKNEE